MPTRNLRPIIPFCALCQGIINNKTPLASKKFSKFSFHDLANNMSKVSVKKTNYSEFTDISSKFNCKYARKSNLKLCVWNAQSLGNKINLVHDYRKEHDLDIMLFTESWLKLEDTVAVGQLENFGEYKFISRSRDHRKGGGIGCLYKSNLRAKKLESFNSKSFEHLILSFDMGGHNIIFMLVYRPEPTAKNRYTMAEFFDEFSQLIASYHCKNQELIIMGDFNFHINKPNLPNVRKFNDLLDTFGLAQHISEPTHVGGNILDLVITRQDSNLLKKCHVDELLSDHFAILMDLDITRPEPIKKTITYRKTKKIKMDKFKEDLSIHLAKKNCIGKQDPDYLNKLIKIYESCKDILDLHAPLQNKTVTVRKATPWNTEDIKQAKTAKRKAEKAWRKNKNCINWEIFKDKRNQYNCTLANLRSTHLRNKIHQNKGNSKALFKIINAELNRKTESPLPPHLNDKDLASEFSEYFENKIDTIRSRLQQNSTVIPASIDNFTGDRLMKFSPVNSQDVGKLIRKMATKHSELDPLPTWMVKECIDELLPIITDIINASLDLGTMPEELKHAIIKPLLKKKGLDLILKNYRPVSNLKFLGKIIEGVIIEQLNQHLNKNSLQDPRQSAYKKNHSTETLLTKVHNDIMLNGNDGKLTLLVMLDLSAAFDTIDHDILLDRLHNMYGIGGLALKWFESYIKHRTNAVMINNKTSDMKTLNYGVPQGSKLGPILFNTYIAPLSEIAKSHQVNDQKYADDEQLILAFKPNGNEDKITKTKMENCIEDIRCFLNNNKLCNNGDKTEIIIVGPKTRLDMLQPDNIIVDNTKIKYAEDVKNLGVILDKHMTMSKQINKMCKSAYFNIKNISHIRKNLSKDDTKTVVNSLVTPHLDYGNCLLYGVSEKYLNKLQVAQNMAVRLIEKLGKRDHVSLKRKELHWLPIHARIKYKLLSITWKTVNNQAPNYLKEIITLKKNTRSLRNNDSKLLEVNNCKTNSWGTRSFSNTSPMLWNSLPERIRKIETFDSFKKHLKTHLFKLYYPD